MQNGNFIELALLFQSIAFVGVIWSRHRLSKRHRNCKDTLNRVASQRDELIYYGLGMISAGALESPNTHAKHVKNFTAVADRKTGDKFRLQK